MVIKNIRVLRQLVEIIMPIAKYKEKLLNEFEARTDNWSFGDFEKRMVELKPGRNNSYHDAKGIINEAHKLGKWPRVVKRYLCTNFKVFGNVSGEFDRIFEDVLNSMTQEEKEQFGILRD